MDRGNELSSSLSEVAAAAAGLAATRCFFSLEAATAWRSLLLAAAAGRFFFDLLFESLPTAAAYRKINDDIQVKD